MLHLCCCHCCCCCCCCCCGVHLQLRYAGALSVNLIAALLYRYFLTPTLPVRAIALLVTWWAFCVQLLYKVSHAIG